MSKCPCPTLLHEEDAEKYPGEYVTVSGPDSKKVLRHGKDAVRVYTETQQMGYASPVIIYVPKHGETFIYHQYNRQSLVDVYA